VSDEPTEETTQSSESDEAKSTDASDEGNSASEETSSETNEASETSDEKPAEESTEDDAVDTPDLAPAEDNRNNTRVNLHRPLILRQTNGETFKAHLVNLSCTGLAFEYPAPATEGATFNILFQLTGKDGLINIQVECVARHSHVRSTSFVIGVEFTKIAEEHVDLIEDFVEFRLTNAAQLTGFAISHHHRG